MRAGEGGGINMQIDEESVIIKISVIILKEKSLNIITLILIITLSFVAFHHNTILPPPQTIQNRTLKETIFKVRLG